MQIADLESQYEFSVNEKERLTKNIGETQARLKRAAKLTTGLADEKIRWSESVQVIVIFIDVAYFILLAAEYCVLGVRTLLV